MIIDFHSHILPCVDDGSKSVAESVEMLQAEASQQIEQVILTPHFYAQQDSPNRFFERRDAAMKRLRAELSGKLKKPHLSLGAEVYFFRGMSNSDVLQEMRIEGTNCIMVEMPMGRWTEGMYRELSDIFVKQGLIPIVAHIDRYISPFATHGIPERLAELPVVVQANAEFFLRKSTTGMALKMLRRGIIQLLGSDCHNLTKRAPNLGYAVEVINQRLGHDAIEWIMENQRNVMNGVYEKR